MEEEITKEEEHIDSILERIPKNYFSITKDHSKKYVLEYQFDLYTSNTDLNSSNKFLFIGGNYPNLDEKELLGEISKIEKNLNEKYPKYNEPVYLISFKDGISGRKIISKRFLINLKQELEGKVKLNLTILDEIN
ncbi:MAG: hypothetical protein WC812_01695 [Candidatus Pacearchaeota archaeon]|jgi:hypothetical protein